MTVVTTLLAPPILRYLFRNEISHPHEQAENVPAAVRL